MHVFVVLLHYFSNTHKKTKDTFGNIKVIIHVKENMEIEGLFGNIVENYSQSRLTTFFFIAPLPLDFGTGCSI